MSFKNGKISRLTRIWLLAPLEHFLLRQSEILQLCLLLFFYLLWIFVYVAFTEKPVYFLLLFSARSHGASATAIGSTIMGVADTCRTKWVQDPLTATGLDLRAFTVHHSRIKGSRSCSVWTRTYKPLINIDKAVINGIRSDGDTTEQRIDFKQFEIKQAITGYPKSSRKP